MYREVIKFLMCPECGAFPLELEALDEAEGDVLSGGLVCPGCGRHYPIVSGVPSFLTWQFQNSKHVSVDINSPPDLIQQAEMKFRDEHSVGFDQGQHLAERKIEIDTVLDELRVDGNHDILDVGCGTGQALIPLIGNSRSLVGVDFSMASLQLLRLKIQRASAARVHLVHAAATRLPFREDSFDRVASIQLLQHLPSVATRSAVLRNISRVTRTNGRFVLSVFYYSFLKRVRGPMLRNPSLDVYEREALHRGKLYYHNFSVRELVDLLVQAGFVPLRKYGVNTPLTRHFGLLGARFERKLIRTPLTLPFAHWIVMSSIRS